VNFRKYLIEHKLSTKVIGDYIYRCRRVEKYEGDLDVHYKLDEGNSLLSRLTYTKQDEKMRCQPSHSIDFKGTNGYKSIYDGTNSLRYAVNKYFEFKHDRLMTELKSPSSSHFGTDVIDNKMFNTRKNC